jgi:hypothetical protein
MFNRLNSDLHDHFLAHTVLALLSGGWAAPGRKILHEIHGWAKHIPAAYVEAQPPYYYIYQGVSTWFNGLPTLPSTSVHLLGNTLHDPDGSLYYVTYAGQDPILFTPTVTGDNFYVFGYNDVAYNINDAPSFTDAPHVPLHLTECTARGNTDNTRTHLGIGEMVDFSDMPGKTTWTVSGKGRISSTSGSSTTFTASLSPGDATVTAHVGDVTLYTIFSIIAPNSIIVNSYSDDPDHWGTQDADGTWMGAKTDYHVYLGPKFVSFNGVTIKENAPSSVSVTWPNGTNTSTPLKSQIVGVQVNCSSFLTDQIAQGLFSRDLLLVNGTYVDFHYYLSWEDQYQNDAGDWIDFVPILIKVEFRGSDKKCRVIYQGFPSVDWQGPFD